MRGLDEAIILLFKVSKLATTDPMMALRAAKMSAKACLIAGGPMQLWRGKEILRKRISQLRVIAFRECSNVTSLLAIRGVKSAITRQVLCQKRNNAPRIVSKAQ